MKQDCYKPIEAGKWVLIHYEDKHKFESKWYEPYKVLSYHSLGTYWLKDSDDNVLVNLINGQRLIKAHIILNANSKDFWALSENQVKLWKENNITKLEKSSSEVQAILDRVKMSLSYDELHTIIKKQWKELKKNATHTGV